jgi:type II secretory pathway pseudopilin PulG
MPNRSLTKNSGLTIIEILVIVIIVLIFAAVIFPHVVDLEGKARRAAARENMTIVETAVKAYALNNDGDYPFNPEDPGFKSFFPGGNCDSKKPSGGNYPENPFTHILEAPLPGNVTDVNKIRQLPASDLGGTRVAGKIFYNALIPAGKKKAVGYAIEGADRDGKALSDPKTHKTYVLSNL